ncbi:MAG: M1 family aminopeptidase [Chitinophagaceae bacterium]
MKKSKIRKIIFVLFIQFNLAFVHAQTIDVLHYKYFLELNDENDRIAGTAEVRIQFLQPLTEFSLDLVQVKANGKGMKVESVTGNGAQFQQVNDKLKIILKTAGKTKQSQTFTISYNGIPEDGLIISKNKYGDRTFFADNWPNRGRNWIPCNDVPNDKASVEFIVTAPLHYQIISNGIQVEETSVSKNKKLTHWKEVIPIPTKVMVIGAAKFAIGRVDSSSCVPVTAWVYPQDKEKGYYDYTLATGILNFFSDYIGPYPFQKLANVQSKTIFGGMENASAIFYSEKSVTGNRSSEDLIAHEIAHQWFGNMATEKNFSHLWLSEGFATYMTDIYIENKYGKDSSSKRLQKERQQVIQFAKRSLKAVVDTTSDFMELLNANSYQKGAWVLHMLRNEVGDSVFRKIIRIYYLQYKGSNADTRDFEAVAEKVSGKELTPFFNQWLYQPGVPKLSVKWRADGNKIKATVIQTGEKLFRFPLQFAITTADGKTTMQKVLINEKETELKLDTNLKPVKIILDPNVSLLFEEVK